MWDVCNPQSRMHFCSLEKHSLLQTAWKGITPKRCSFDKVGCCGQKMRVYIQFSGRLLRTETFPFKPVACRFALRHQGPAWRWVTPQRSPRSALYNGQKPKRCSSVQHERLINVLRYPSVSQKCVLAGMKMTFFPPKPFLNDFFVCPSSRRNHKVLATSIPRKMIPKCCQRDPWVSAKWPHKDPVLVQNHSSWPEMDRKKNGPV